MAMSREDKIRLLELELELRNREAGLPPGQTESPKDLANDPSFFEKAMGLGEKALGAAGNLATRGVQALPETGQTQSTAANVAIGTPRAIGETIIEGLPKVSQQVRQGTQEIANLLPEQGQTSSTALNVAIGAPRAAVESLGETSAQFVEPEALALGGAGKAIAKSSKAIQSTAKAAGKGLAKTQQLFTGVESKNFLKLMDDPGALFASTDKASGKFGKALVGATKRGGRSKLKIDEFTSERNIVKQAIKKSKKEGLNAREALEARQATDDMLAKVAKTPANSRKIKRLRRLRDRFNKVVKKDPDLKTADKAVERAKTGQAVRKAFPQTKSGEASLVRTGLAGGAGFANPLAAAAFSPAVQGGVASGLGALGKLGKGLLNVSSGKSGQAAGALLEELKKRRR